MGIAKSALLTGHVASGVVRNIITTAVVIGVAFIVGFRPQAGFLAWLAIIGIIIFVMVALTWIAVLAGVKAKAPENTTSGLFLLFILPFLSSGFTPTENLPSWLQWFAQHQPMTPIIDALRGLMLDMPTGNAIPIALAWCAGITIVSFFLRRTCL
jgi:ABC-2 type transport system permease protein